MIGKEYGSWVKKVKKNIEDFELKRLPVQYVKMPREKMEMLTQTRELRDADRESTYLMKR